MTDFTPASSMAQVVSGAPAPLTYPDTTEAMYQRLKSMLGDVVPEFELKHKAELAVEINRLKVEKNAVILGHNYMEPALFHSVPDYTGDSLQLARLSAQSDADIIIFCGVLFMAETAKILNPERTVLLPSDKGGCSLASSITAEDVRNIKALYPGVPVVSYVNTYADVKAETDICCTSSNAADVARHLMDHGHQQIIFIPDEFLSANVAREVEADIIFPVRVGETLQKPGDPENFERVFIGWQGRCEVHEKFSVNDIKMVRQQFPDVFVLAHPECPPDVVAASDFSGSTTAMIHKVEDMDATRYLLLTECSMGDNIAAANPDKEMVRLCSVRCPHMNEITLEETLKSLQEVRHKVELDPELASKAKASLDRMLEIG